jgi:hypothetical protein
VLSSFILVKGVSLRKKISSNFLKLNLLNGHMFKMHVIFDVFLMEHVIHMHFGHMSV